MKIEDIQIKHIFTSNYKKSIEIEMKTRKGNVRSSVPVIGNGIYKNRQLSPDDAIKKFLDIKRHFLNNDFSDMQEVDTFIKSIDKSTDFREIGGNLAFGISSAFVKALAKYRDMKVYEYISSGKQNFPSPLAIITNRQKSQTDFQEYMLYPVQQKSFEDSIRKLLSIYESSNEKFQKEKNLTMSKIFRTLSDFTTSQSLQIGFTVRATDLWNTRRYTYSTGENLTPQEQILFMQDVISNYPIGYIEDPFHEEDFVLHSTLTHRLPTRIVAGNNLYSNNKERIKNGFELKATSGIVLTPSEMGTITDFLNIVKEAKKNKMSVTVASPENDTNDFLPCHLAVGTGCQNIKIDLGQNQSGRINELFAIEKKLS
ncbi:MAG: hypothetical protein HYW22_00315 [Candidatus Aenigmarchaeota archaeon]|nr:hypothetical protein [Candidatus Aenigmarchaeota archaeon]